MEIKKEHLEFIRKCDLNNYQIEVVKLALFSSIEDSLSRIADSLEIRMSIEGVNLNDLENPPTV